MGRRRRTVRRGLALGAAPLLLSSCWLQIGGGPTNQRYNPLEDELNLSNVASLEEAWSTHVPGSLSEPVILGDRLYFSSLSNDRTVDVYAYDTEAGDMIWKRTLSSELHSLVASSVDPAVIVGDEVWFSYSGRTQETSELEHDFIRFDRSDGSIISRQDEVIWSRFVSGDGVVAYVRSPGELVVRDVETSEVLWAYDDLPFETVTGPLIHEERLHLAVGSRLFAFELSCSDEPCVPLWSRSRSTLAEDLSAGPAGEIIDSRPYSWDDSWPGDPSPIFSSMPVFDGESGYVLWRGQVPNITGQIAVTSDYVFAGTDDVWVDESEYARRGWHGMEGVAAFNIEECRQVEFWCDPAWHAKIPGDPPSGFTDPFFGASLVVGGGVLYTSAEDVLYAFDAGGCGETICEPLAGFPDVGEPRSLAHGQLYATRPHPEGSGTILTALSPTGG